MQSYLHQKRGLVLTVMTVVIKHLAIMQYLTLWNIALVVTVTTSINYHLAIWTKSNSYIISTFEDHLAIWTKSNISTLFLLEDLLIKKWRL
jgi:hypothetical protein